MYIDLKVETNYTTVRNRLFCPMANFYAIGCMSGSSLDGVDLCYVEFIGSVETDEWQHRILKAKTVPYSSEWRQKLRLARGLTGVQLIKLHIEYGHFIGKTVQDFIKSETINDLNFIASHGHTIFHDPTEGYTFQLGDGETSAIYLDRPFICNFRNKDVALKGQGAPLVPNGEKFLFREIDICINLGGIANIGASCIPGYDVCPCNYVSNKLANVFDPELEFDMDGKIARQGKILEDVLAHLEQLPFYTQVPPKSLGAEWIDDKVMPLMNVQSHSIQDLLRTFIEHVTIRLAEACRTVQRTLYSENNRKDLNILVTGGGAFNSFLMGKFENKLADEGFKIVKTNENTVAFKEALVFAFLGLRCLLSKENVLCSITGSQRNSISGSLHKPGIIV